jgi:hypothetical protein
MAQVIVKQIETPVKVTTTNEVVRITAEEVAVQVKAYNVVQVPSDTSNEEFTTDLLLLYQTAKL